MSRTKIHRPSASLPVFLLILSLAIFLALLGVYASTFRWEHGFLRDFNTLVIGRDFINFWMAGKAAWQPDPARYYEPSYYNAALDAVVGSPYHFQQWSYPPTLLLFAAPLGLLPYGIALLLWTAGGIGLLGTLLYRISRSFLITALPLVSVAALINLVSGQNACFTAALMLAGFHLLPRRPIIAGILFGLLSVKPQLGLLIPVMLLAARQWRTIAAAAATTLGLAGTSAALFGLPMWTAYFSLGIPAQKIVLLDPPRIIQALMPTPFIDLRALGVGYDPAIALQMFITLFAAVCVYRRFRRPSDPRLDRAFFATASVLATPYLMAYDLLFLTTCLIMLFQDRLSGAKDERLALSGFFFAVLHYVGIALHFPVFTVIPVALLFWLGQKTRALSASIS